MDTTIKKDNVAVGPKLCRRQLSRVSLESVIVDNENQEKNTVTSECTSIPDDIAERQLKFKLLFKEM